MDPGDSTVTARVGIGPEDGAYGLVVTLIIHIPGLEREQTRELAEAAPGLPVLTGHTRQYQRRTAHPAISHRNRFAAKR